MASLALAFDVLAKDHASKTLDKVGDHAEKTGKRVKGAFSGLGKVVAGVFAGVAVGSFLKGAIAEATEAVKVGAQTNAVIKSTGGAARITAAHVGKLATKLSNLAGVDDELVQQGENVLLTFTSVRNEVGKGNDVFDQATSLALDMSKALGTDLQGSVIQVGKALNDPIKGITALQRVGVSFTEQQKKQIKTLVESGKTLDAQKLILSELRREFGGTAAAVATPAEKLQAAWANLKEQIGGPVLTVLNALANFLSTKVIPAISNLGNTIGPVAKRIFDGISGIYAFVAKGDFNAAFGRAFHLSDDSPVVGKLFDFRDKVVAVIGKIRDTFATIGGKIQTALDGFVPNAKKFASNLASGVASAAGTIIDGVKTGLDKGDWKPLGKTIGEALVNVLKGTADLGGKLYDAVKNAFSKVDWVGLGIEIGKQLPSLLIGIAAGILNFDLWGLLKGLGKHWQDILLAILTIAFTPGRVLGKVGELLGKVPLVGTLLKWAFEHFVKFSKGLVKFVFDALGTLGKAFLKGLIGEEPKVLGGLRKFIGNIITWLYVKADDFLKAGQRLPGKIGEGIVKGVEALGRAVRWLGAQLTSLLGKAMKGAGELALSALRAVWRRLPEVLAKPVRDGIAAVGAKFGSLLGYLRGLPRRVSGALFNMWDGLKTSFKSALNWIISKWNAFHLTLGGGSILGQKIPSITLNTPNIPLLAQGGLVPHRPGGVLAQIGEGRFDELVLPLSPKILTALKGKDGGDTYQVTIHNPVPERASESVPSALRKAAFLAGVR